MEKYKKIKESIKKFVDSGLNVCVENILSKKTISSIEEVCKETYRLGAKKISFLRLKPIGNAAFLPNELFLEENDIEEIIKETEKIKEKYDKKQLYLSFSFAGFGPNFKSLEKAKEKMNLLALKGEVS